MCNPVGWNQSKTSSTRTRTQSDIEASLAKFHATRITFLLALVAVGLLAGVELVANFWLSAGQLRWFADLASVATAYPLLLPLLAVALLGPASGMVAAVVALVDPSILLVIDSSSTRCCGALAVGMALFILVSSSSSRRTLRTLELEMLHGRMTSLEQRLFATICLQLVGVRGRASRPEVRRHALEFARGGAPVCA